MVMGVYVFSNGIFSDGGIICTLRYVLRWGCSQVRECSLVLINAVTWGCLLFGQGVFSAWLGGVSGRSIVHL